MFVQNYVLNIIVIFLIYVFLICWSETYLMYKALSYIGHIYDNRLSREKEKQIIKQLEERKNIRISSAIFSVVSIGIMHFLFNFYIDLEIFFVDNIFFYSGIALALWLLLVGKVIVKVYRLIESTMYKRQYLQKSDQRLLLVTMSIFFALIKLPSDYKVTFMMIAIIIGRFLWLDSEVGGIVCEIKEIYFKPATEVREAIFKIVIPLLLAVGLLVFGINFNICLIIMSLMLGIISSINLIYLKLNV